MFYPLTLSALQIVFMIQLWCWHCAPYKCSYYYYYYYYYYYNNKQCS